MNRLLSLFWVLAAITGVSASCGSSNTVKPYNQGINITPTPVELKQKEGNFTLSGRVVFSASREESRQVAAFFSGKIKQSTGFELAIRDARPAADYIDLQLQDDLPVNREGYLLEVAPEGISVRATTARGLFYGMQTVMQLLPAEIESPTPVRGVAWSLPAVSIRDEPRFPYRGMHLDVCRHFVGVDFIKKQLDVMALYKVNKFHWHLTDDQGWRIEIKKYPRLTEVGAQRTEGEGNVYGPCFFTQEEVKEVVAYAKARFIEVIPEIELPGHAVAAIAAYPELGCTRKEIPVRCYWGVANDVFCVGRENTFRFLEDVLTEVIPLFESDYIHIGGDECPKIRWKNCPDCQARIKSLGLKADANHSAEELLQSYCVQRIEKFLLTHNKKIIGWDEILEGGLAPSATVMSWRGESGGIASANMGHDVIMTPGGWFYMDRYQGDPKILPVTIGGSLNLAKTYSYEPIPEAIAPEKHHHILGAQCNNWNEYNYTGSDMEYDIYPRLLAMAELTWTPAERKEYADFERRVENQRVRLDMHDINYYIPVPEQAGMPSCNHIAFTESTTQAFTSSEPVTMLYTTDGSEPTARSAVYSEPLTFTENTTLKIRSMLLSGKMGATRTIQLEKQTYAPAVVRNPETPAGIRADYYIGNTLTVEELSGRTPSETEYLTSPGQAKYKVNGYSEVYPEDYRSIVMTGYMNIPEDGVYYFSTNHELWIDGELFISNEKENHGTARRFSRSDRSIALARGSHAFKLVRLGAIFGGWPTQWDSVNIDIRREGEPKFGAMNSSWFL